MSKYEILNCIDEVEIVQCESAISVIDSLMDSYDKYESIVEYAEDIDVYNEPEYYQESADGENKEEKKGGSLSLFIKKIIEAIKRFFLKIGKGIKGLFKKSDNVITTAKAANLDKTVNEYVEKSDTDSNKKVLLLTAGGAVLVGIGGIGAAAVKFNKTQKMNKAAEAAEAISDERLNEIKKTLDIMCKDDVPLVCVSVKINQNYNRSFSHEIDADREISISGFNVFAIMGAMSGGITFNDIYDAINGIKKVSRHFEKDNDKMTKNELITTVCDKINGLIKDLNHYVHELTLNVAWDSDNKETSLDKFKSYYNESINNYNKFLEDYKNGPGRQLVEALDILNDTISDSKREKIEKQIKKAEEKSEKAGKPVTNEREAIDKTGYRYESAKKIIKLVMQYQDLMEMLTETLIKLADKTLDQAEKIFNAKESDFKELKGAYDKYKKSKNDLSWSVSNYRFEEEDAERAGRKLSVTEKQKYEDDIKKSKQKSDKDTDDLNKTEAKMREKADNDEAELKSKQKNVINV